MRHVPRLFLARPLARVAAIALALAIAVAGCGASNDEPCQENDDCSSEFCCKATPSVTARGVCMSVGAMCTMVIVRDSGPAIDSGPSEAGISEGGSDGDVDSGAMDGDIEGGTGDAGDGSITLDAPMDAPVGVDSGL